MGYILLQGASDSVLVLEPYRFIKRLVLSRGRLKTKSSFSSVDTGESGDSLKSDDGKGHRGLAQAVRSRMSESWQEAYGPLLKLQDYIPQSKDSALWLGSVLYVCHNHVSSFGPIGLVYEDQGARYCVQGYVLDTFLKWSFWRFDLRLQLYAPARQITYWIEIPHAVKHMVHVDQRQFTVPGASQTWRWAAYSCSGYSSSVDRSKWGGDHHPMVQDLLRENAKDPFHALVGGGDQLYNDGVFQDSVEVANWLKVKNRRQRLAVPFSDKMREESEWFYFKNYCMSFSQLDIRDAFACIPNVMIWDDHDIFDGWGSYPDDLLHSPVFQGIYQVACRFYLLFQQHVTYNMILENRTELFGRMGYCNHASFNFLKRFGPDVAIVGVDIRAERTKRQILSNETWEMIFTRINALPSCVRHVIVLLTVPILYPKVPLTEASLEMLSFLNHFDAVNTLMQKTGLLSNIMEFDEPELLDDLVDHWTSGPHTAERKVVVNRLQSIAKSKGIRVTFLSGDVHCAALGRFYTDPKIDLTQDHRYMPQIISSAIVNAPPPNVLIKMMDVFNVAKKSVNECTKEKMVRVFKGRYKQSDKVMGRRNYLIVQGDQNTADGLLCTLRIEEPDRLGSSETFDIYVPPLLGFSSSTPDPPTRPVSLPPERHRPHSNCSSPEWSGYTWGGDVITPNLSMHSGGIHPPPQSHSPNPLSPTSPPIGNPYLPPHPIALTAPPSGRPNIPQYPPPVGPSYAQPYPSEHQPHIMMPPPGQYNIQPAPDDDTPQV